MKFYKFLRIPIIKRFLKHLFFFFFENLELKEEILEKMYCDFMKNDNMAGFIDVKKYSL